MKRIGPTLVGVLRESFYLEKLVLDRQADNKKFPRKNC
jgi:hypothetical protein